MTLFSFQYTQTVLSTIQNPDGTVSLYQVDPNNPIITLPDGTTAQVQGVATVVLIKWDNLKICIYMKYNYSYIKAKVEQRFKLFRA